MLSCGDRTATRSCRPDRGGAFRWLQSAIVALDGGWPARRSLRSPLIFLRTVSGTSKRSLQPLSGLVRFRTKPIVPSATGASSGSHVWRCRRAVLAAARVLLRDQADPGSQIPTDLKACGLGTLATSAVAISGPMPGMRSSRRLASRARQPATSRCAIRDGAPYADEVVSPLSSGTAAPVLVSKRVRLIADLAGTFDA
jgi:hypothetical protein